VTEGFSSSDRASGADIPLSRIGGRCRRDARQAPVGSLRSTGNIPIDRARECGDRVRAGSAARRDDREVTVARKTAHRARSVILTPRDREPA